jgi:chemotaxis protein MotA
MKATTAIGIVVAFVGLALGATMEGSQIPAFFNVPALVIIMSGTIGSVMASNSFEGMKAIPTLYKKAIGGEVPDLNERAQLLVGLAERARREGLLALDDEIAKIDDAFVKKGLQLVVDGTDADVVAEVLEIETEAMAGRHGVMAKVFKDAGGFAPTIGIIGTVMGLVHVLENLSQPEELGHLIAGAFVATLWGVLTANVLWLPIGNKLKRVGEIEAHHMQLVMEGVLAVQAGANPRVIEQKLLSFLSPKERSSGATEKAA